MACLQRNTASTPIPRDYGFDNLRGILIFCVVLGHLLEICVPFLGSVFLYQLIYSFHMPAMLFLLGYFARFSFRKLLCSWALPYLLLQICYILFANYILGDIFPLQFHTPYWILWFLLVGLYYHLLIPLYDRKAGWCKVLLLSGSILAALLVGYIDTIGYSGSLSRFFVFQPFFLLGFYAEKRGTSIPKKKWQTLAALISLGIFLCCAAILYRWRPNSAILYGAHPYSELGHNALIRAFFLGMGFCAIVFLIYGCKPLLDRKIPLLTCLGQNTLSVFLLHGFAVKFLGRYFPQTIKTPWAVLLITCGLLLLLGNPLVGKAVRFLCSDRWLPKRKSKTPTA